MKVEIFEKIADQMLESGSINSEDKEIYKYGLKHIAAVLLNIATTVVIGFIFGMILESVLFVVSYVPLRSYAGGYHARTPLRCYIFSAVLTGSVLMIMKHFPNNDILILSLICLSGIIIFIFSPIGDENKPLDKAETNVFKKRARIILFAEIGMICLAMILNFNIIKFSIFMGVLCSCFMLAVALIKSKLK